MCSVILGMAIGGSLVAHADSVDTTTNPLEFVATSVRQYIAPLRLILPCQQLVHSAESVTSSTATVRF
ncbi:MAG: hypothetical protein ACLS3V_06605 [Streptococcus sp.]